MSDKKFYQTTKGKIFIRDDGRLRALAEKVLLAHPIPMVDLDDIEFMVVESDTGPYLGKCYKIPAVFRVFVDAKFLIVLNVTQIEAQKPGIQDKVMWHELRHTNTEMDVLRKHDTEDFAIMLSAFGIDWKVNDKSIVPIEELRELTPWAMPGNLKTAKELLVGLDQPTVAGPA